MGWYDEQVVPRVVEVACGSSGLAPWRRAALEGLSGTVVEIGFGSGHNLASYPPEVTLIYAVEPSAVARRRAAERVARSAIPVEFVGLDGTSIPLDNASCDGAVAAFTLCTIPEVSVALAELRRVLRPGGRFHFLEHGASPDHGVARWQRRIDPVQQRLAGGCHLTRDPESLVREAGFEVLEVASKYAPGPRPWSWFTRGIARNPDPT